MHSGARLKTLLMQACYSWLGLCHTHEKDAFLKIPEKYHGKHTSDRIIKKTLSRVLISANYFNEVSKTTISYFHAQQKNIPWNHVKFFYNGRWHILHILHSKAS